MENSNKNMTLVFNYYIVNSPIKLNPSLEHSVGCKCQTWRLRWTLVEVLGLTNRDTFENDSENNIWRTHSEQQSIVSSPVYGKDGGRYGMKSAPMEIQSFLNSKYLFFLHLCISTTWCYVEGALVNLFISGKTMYEGLPKRRSQVMLVLSFHSILRWFVSDLRYVELDHSCIVLWS